MEDKFKFPDTQTDQALVTAGRMFAEDANAFTKAFIGQGMRRTFIADLTALVDRFEQAIKDRSAGGDAHAVARASIAKALALGTAAAQKLDAMMVNHQQDDPVTIALWRRDRTVGHARRQRKRKAVSEPPQAVTSQPAAPTTPPAAPPLSPPPAAGASPGKEAAADQGTSDQKVA
jgi:hypothetical protein